MVGFQVRFFVQSGLTISVDTYVYVCASITTDTWQLIMIRQSVFEAFRFTYIYRFPLVRRRLSCKDVISCYVVPVSADWIDFVFVLLTRDTYPYTFISHSITPSNENYTTLIGGVNSGQINHDLLEPVVD